jgi:hypothetical protein
MNEIKSQGRALGVQLCSAAAQSIEIAGQVFTPDKFTAYAEFYLSHAFPVFLDTANPGEEPDRTTIHPQTIANSYASLRGKVVNLAHMMVYNDPLNVVSDRIYGSVMAVEFPAAPAGGWKVQGEAAAAPGIRVVAALHKDAVGVPLVIQTWEQGKTPFGQTKWTVSMENECFVETGGFLIKTAGGKSPVPKHNTPDDFQALGWIYIPYGEAPGELLACLRTEGGFGIIQKYLGLETLYLNGGLNGSILFKGVALTPVGKESHARVARINASAADAAGLAAAEAMAAALKTLGEFLEKAGVRNVHAPEK